MFDFPLRYAMVDVFCQDAHPGRLVGVLSLDRLYDNPRGLVTFLDNHDLPRIASGGGERRRVVMRCCGCFRCGASHPSPMARSGC